MLIKVIKFTIKFEIFDLHYPHFPFCNFQNSVSVKMRCCLTFVCVYILSLLFVFIFANNGYFRDINSSFVVTYRADLKIMLGFKVGLPLQLFFSQKYFFQRFAPIFMSLSDIYENMWLSKEENTMFVWEDDHTKCQSP